jgi:hypothetical protein
MGILLGKDLGRGRIDTTHLQIYENGTIGKTWKKMLSQKFDFDHACREFVFSNQNKEILYFFTAFEIFEYNYLSLQKKTKYTYHQKLQSQPIFGKFDDDQQRFIVTSENDAMFVDTQTNTHLDLDQKEGLQAIEDVFYHDGQFFILANKVNHKLGFYLMSFDASQPEEPCKLIVAWNHMLDIADADI